MIRRWHGWPALPTIFVLVFATACVYQATCAPAPYDKAKAAEYLAICLNKEDGKKKKTPQAIEARNTALCDVDGTIAKNIANCIKEIFQKASHAAPSDDQRKELVTGVLNKVCLGIKGAGPTAKLSLSDVKVKWAHIEEARSASQLYWPPDWLYDDTAFPTKFAELFESSNYNATAAHPSCIGPSNREDKPWVVVCIAVNKASGEEEIIKIASKGVFDKDIELFRILKSSKLPFMSHLIAHGSSSDSVFDYYTIPLWGKNMDMRMRANMVRPNNFKALLKTMLEQVRQMHDAGLAHGQLELWNVAVNSKTPRALSFYGLGVATLVTRDDAGGMVALEDYEHVMKILEIFGQAPTVPHFDPANPFGYEFAATQVVPADYGIDVYEKNAAAKIRGKIISPVRTELKDLLKQDNAQDDAVKPTQENRFKQARAFALFDRLHYGIEAALGLDEFDAEDKMCLYTDPKKENRDEAEKAGTTCDYNLPVRQPVTPVKFDRKKSKT